MMWPWTRRSTVAASGGLHPAARALSPVHREEHGHRLVLTTPELDRALARTVLLREREQEVGDDLAGLAHRGGDDGLVPGREQSFGQMGERGHPHLVRPLAEPGHRLLRSQLLVHLGAQRGLVAFPGRIQRPIELVHASSLADGAGRRDRRPSALPSSRVRPCRGAERWRSTVRNPRTAAATATTGCRSRWSRSTASPSTRERSSWSSSPAC